MTACRTCELVERRDAAQGPRIFTLLGLPEDRSVPEARMNEIAATVRARLRP